MIMCHCNVITQADIERTVYGLLDRNQWDIILPDAVYRALIQEGRCCGCYPLVIEEITRIVTQYHTQKHTPRAKIADLVQRILCEFDLRYG